MIQNIKLHNFGKFKDTAFDFSEVTLFYGKNEAGKTTIFDALYKHFCRPNKNDSYKRLERYEEENQNAEIFCDIEEKEPIDKHDFLRVYAIATGDITVFENDKSNNNKLLDSLRASIFSDGMDPEKVRSVFSKIRTTKAKGTPLKIKEEAEKERDQAQQKLQEQKQKRDSIVSRVSMQTGLKQEIENLESKISTLNSRIEDTEKKIGYQDKIDRKVRYEKLYAMLEDYWKEKQNIENNAVFSEDKSDQLRQIETALNKEKDNLDRVHSQLLQVKNDLDRNEKEIENKKQYEESLYDRVRESALVFDRISSFCNNMPTKSNITVNPVLLVLTGLGVAVSGVLFFILPSGLPSVIGGAAPLLAAGICAVFGINRRNEEDTDKIKSFLDEQQKKWAKMYPNDQNIISAPDLGQFTDELKKLNHQYEPLKKERTEREAERKTLTEKREELDKKIKELDERCQKLEKQKTDWLAEYGAEDLRHYQQLVASYQNNYQKFSKLERQLQEEAGREGISSFEQLEPFLRRHIRDLEEAGVPTENYLSRQDVNRLKTELQELKKEHEKSTEALGKAREGKKDVEGEMRGALSGLPESIHELEVKISELYNKIEEQKMQIEAAKVNEEIFSNIANDTRYVFETIGTEVANLFQKVLNQNIRTVQVDNFTDILVEDAGGKKRQLTHLSTGTHEAYAFAMRLFFAERMSDSRYNKFLILDDPFLMMDDVREERALMLLKEFAETHKWQVIIFSKEAHMPKSIKKVFPESKTAIHSL